jgi:CubicO group peptidase (beta-lactamase class C family)
MVSSGVVAGAAAVVHGDQVETFTHGVLQSGGNEPVLPTSPFHICSCSKAFTALAFARLVTERGIAWDTPVQLALPEFELSDPWITERCTFRDLAGMRLGLARTGIAEWGFRAEAPVESRLARIRSMGFDAPFRDRFSYSNLNYILLASSVARVSGEPFEACLRARVFEPMGLTHAALTASPISPLPHMVLNGANTAVSELTGDNSQGSARVHLSAEDAAAWLAGLLELSLGDADVEIAEIFRPQSLIRVGDHEDRSLPVAWAYGFGWLLADFCGHVLWMHGGGGRGWRTMTMLDPEHRIGVMVMLAHEGSTAEALALELLDLANGRKPVDRESLLTARAHRAWLDRAVNNLVGDDAAPSPGAASIDGTYSNPVTGIVQIASSPQGVRFEAQDAPIFAATLMPTGQGLFDFTFDNSALSRMPGDPEFRARFAIDRTGVTELRTSYFGLLRRTGSGP